MAKSEADVRKRRGRKRKRREVSESSSSSQEEESDSGAEPTKPALQKPLPAVNPPSPEESSSDESDSDDSEPPSQSSQIQSKQASDPKPSTVSPAPKSKRQPSRSPSPPSTALPAFLPEQNREEKEKELSDRFRKYWMASLADGFADELDEIRKEPSMTKPRLELLIDSLASGANLFTSASDESGRQRKLEEMKLVLGEP